MAYRISYDNASKMYRKEKRSIGKYRIFLRLMVVVLVCVLGVSVLSGKINTLLEYLVPGDPELTRQALSTMAEEIKAGDSLKEAFTTFCREIVENANDQG